MTLFINLFCLLIIYSPLLKAESNPALDEWRAFSEKTGNPDHLRWVSEISKPEAIELAKSWKKLRGYDAHDLIEQANLANELIIGLNINRENINKYPWIKKYLPKEMYLAVSASDGYIKSITIVPTNTYYMNRSVLNVTKYMLDKGMVPHTDNNSTLRNPDGNATLLDNKTAAGIPYLHPQNGLELNWNYVAHGVGTETLVFDPLIATVCTPARKLERKYKALLWWQKFHGRTLIGTDKDIPDKEGLIEGGAIFALSPFDVRGFAGVRQRYADGQIADDFKIFLPSVKRTRILSGTDAQDPIWAGLELTWDDWRAYWVKTDIKKFDYNLIGETFILAMPETGYVYNPVTIKSDCIIENMELELRPVWILEIVDKTNSYQYKKRTTYIDKEFNYLQWHVTTDQRGSVFRTWSDSRAWRPYDGDAQWNQIIIHNELNNRLNFIHVTPVWDGRKESVTDEQFDIDQLRDYR